jgi:hypothetical protein
MKGMAHGAVTWSGVASVSMGATATSDAIRIENIGAYALQMVWSGGGAPNGTFKLQGSNDLGPQPPTSTSTVQSVANWTDLANSSQTISADGDHMWNVSQAGYRWVRVVYTRSSGTGTMAGRFNGKG